MLRTELWHAALAHFPIAFLSTASLLFFVHLVFSVRGHSAPRLQFCYRFLLFSGFGCATLNMFLGDEAMTIVGMNICNRSILYDHEDYAYYLLICSGLATVSEIFFLGVRSQLKKQIPPGLSNAYMAVLLSSVLYTLVVTSHLGGKLVYEQGAGVLNATCSRD